MTELTVGVECGNCGGPVYFEPCPEHTYALASECQRCGARHEIVCPDCLAGADQKGRESDG